MEKTKIGRAVPQLPVEDVERAQIYYKEILGFEIAWTYPDKSIGAVGRGETAIFFPKRIYLSYPISTGFSQKMLT